MVDGLILTFNFKENFPYIDLALQTVKKRIFENVTPVVWKKSNWVAQIENALECYKLTADEEEDPRNIDIAESTRYHEVNGSEIEIPNITKPLNTKKVNIGSEKEPKFATIGYY